MSISSYRRNVSLGVTGKFTETCYPAALEQLSPRNRFEPTMYRKYARFAKWYENLEGQGKRQGNPAYKDMLSEMAWSLGEVEFDDIEFERADTYRDFSRIVRTMLRHDYRVAIDVRIVDCPPPDYHAIGIVSVGDDYYRGVSTWMPQPLRGYFDLRQAFETIYMHDDPPRVLYPFNDANITALPPPA